MSAATSQQRPSIPPRPSRSQDKDTLPRIPPRPVNRRIERSLSPNPDRFAPSPLNESPFPSKSSNLLSVLGPNHNGDPIDRPQSVEMPSVGEEGREYELMNESMNESASPERTRTVGKDLKLHAPKPSLPAQSAKQRVMTVTRTDSDKAASFGIGKPSSEEHPSSSSNRSLKKKASTISQQSATESLIEDEQGIPEIGQQVPMYPDAGDVQAPSPAPPTSTGTEGGRRSRNHVRKTSALGGLPPGSYGLHGHGVAPQDKLEKAYFDKHPHLLSRERTPHHHDRPNDFSMSSEDLNKIVRETASHGPGLDPELAGTPSEQLGWQAIEESTSHVASASPGLADVNSPLKQAFHPESMGSDSNLAEHRTSEDAGVIHVEERDRRRSVMFSDDGTPDHEASEEHVYNAPILAEDEVRKHPSLYDHHPAVEPPSSAFEPEEGNSRPSSRPSSRPTSLYRVSSMDHQSTPLEDVEEYEPLFPDDGKPTTREPAGEPSAKKQKVHTQRFPSRDIWEDAPDSVYYTAHVSTPDVSERPAKAQTTATPPARDGETPAQAFARHQEELAERESRQHGADAFLPTQTTQKPIWAKHQSHLANQQARPSPAPRFPSRDVWEDAPDSLQLETTVSTPQQDPDSESPAETKPGVPQRPVRKTTDPSSGSERPAIPLRPKPKQSSSEEDVTSPPSATSSSSKGPSLPGRPKPHIPARPAKASPTPSSSESGEAVAAAKRKPAVPARPMAGKIAALQAGFMSDLNKKLGLGPQAPKKEDPPAEEEKVSEPKEKVPLSDARKGRARGPQRRAPAKSRSPAAAPSEEEPKKVSFSFSVPSTVFEIDPEAGDVSVGGSSSIVEKAPVVSAIAEHEPANPEVKEEKNEEETVDKSPEVEAEVPAVSSEEKEDEAPAEETKSLATNMAGEPLVEETIRADEEHDEVEPTKVEEH